MPQVRWTTEEEKQLRELAAAGIETAKIARQLGRSRSAVRTRVCKLKIPVAKAGHKGRGLKVSK
jgi:hypothetical protein